MSSTPRPADPGPSSTARAPVILIYLAAIAAGAFGGTLLTSSVTPRAMPASYAWLIKSTVVALLVIVITRSFMKRTGRGWPEYGVSKGRMATPIALGALGGLALGGAWVAAVAWFAPFDLAWNPHVIAAQVLATSVGTVAMGIAEETGYRTYALFESRRRFGFAAAVLLTSAVFVAAHVAGGVPWQAGVLVVGSASVLFAVLMLETGSLPLVVALHAASNLVQDNVLRPVPVASLFTMHIRAPLPAGSELGVWMAMAVIHLAVAAATLAVSRSRR